MPSRSEIADDFTAGLLLVAPLVVTLIVLSFLVQWTSIVIDPLVRETRLVNYTANIEILAKIVAAFIVIIIITFMGYVSRQPVGRGMKQVLGRVPAVVPFFGTIYLSVRQMASSIGDADNRFKKLVTLEYPIEGVYSLGLVTSLAPEELQPESGPERYTVYLPNSPNPTGGRTVIVPEDGFEEVDMSIQAGLKLMLTTGMGGQDRSDTRGSP